jgi:hypothetical protein
MAQRPRASGPGEPEAGSAQDVGFERPLPPQMNISKRATGFPATEKTKARTERLPVRTFDSRLLGVEPNNMSIILPFKFPGNPIKVVASCDTVELFVYKPPKGMRRLIEQAQQGKIKTRNVFKHGRYVGTIFAVNQPKPAVLPVLDWLVEHVPWCWRHRFDIAFDLEAVNGADEDRCFETLDLNGILKWPSKKARKIISDHAVRWEQKTRTISLYRKRKHTIRLELRFTGARSVQQTMKWLGMRRFQDLVGLDARKLAHHHFKLVTCKGSYVMKAVRGAVKEDRTRYLRKASRVEDDAFLDRYRANIARRVRHIYARMDLFQFKRGRRNAERCIEGMDLSWLGIPSGLVWPDSGGGVFENIGSFREGVGQGQVTTNTADFEPSHLHHARS